MSSRLIFSTDFHALFGPIRSNIALFGPTRSIHAWIGKPGRFWTISYFPSSK